MFDNENVMSADDDRFESMSPDDLLKEPAPKVPSYIEAERERAENSYLTPIEPEYSSEQDDALTRYLKYNGVSDPSKIQFEDDNGDIREVAFNELSSEEQDNIMMELGRPDISDDEINTINFLRQNRMSMQQAMDSYANYKLQEYINQNQTSVSYSVDDYSDDELYVGDLKLKYPDFTDEQLFEKLNNAKENPELYEAETRSLREYYRQQEQENRNAQIQSEIDAQNQYRDSLYNSINAFNGIALDWNDANSDTLEIEVEDKQKVLSYLLDKDANGKTQFVKDIEDPDSLIELAWLRVGGADALSYQNQYFKEIISERNKEISRLKKQIDKYNNPTRKGNDDFYTKTGLI